MPSNPPTYVASLSQSEPRSSEAWLPSAAHRSAQIDRISKGLRPLLQQDYASVPAFEQAGCPQAHSKQAEDRRLRSRQSRKQNRRCRGFRLDRSCQERRPPATSWLPLEAEQGQGTRARRPEHRDAQLALPRGRWSATARRMGKARHPVLVPQQQYLLEQENRQALPVTMHRQEGFSSLLRLQLLGHHRRRRRAPLIQTRVFR